jgi:undecaprenyl-diphosphatase
MGGAVDPITAFILGVVEGVTEYLPVSSTGHLIVASTLLHANSKSFEIVIQAGAVLAVVVHYRALLAARVRGLVSGSADARRLLAALALGFLPAAVVGLALRKAIQSYLFGVGTVAGAFVVGGVLMIVVERVRKSRGIEGVSGLENVTPMRGLLIGVGQVFSLFPGASRSMCTIVAGQLTGLSTATAAEFSFLLALPTLLAACAYEGWRGRHELAAVGGINVAVGLVVSFLVAWAVIASFLRYLQRRGLEPFGWYRIVAGALLLWLWTRGIITP